MTHPQNLLSQILANDPGVNGKYQHGPKRATPGETLETEGAILKWYSVHFEDEPVPERITQLARTYLQKDGLEARGFGFVILHRCGNDFYFLIVSTWRGNNEAWETVFYKNGDTMKDFALFPRDGQHKPTFCVWEMVPLWHEQKAWVRFLGSKRDNAAAEAWLRDLYFGPA
jgi:hypothetical protein